MLITPPSKEVINTLWNLTYLENTYVRFCCKDDLVWVQACCYLCQKKNDPMHQLKFTISCNAPYCSCVAGCSGMCNHVVGLLKQLIYYVMMKLKSVPAYLTCTQMQKSWHKPRSTEIEPFPVMNVAFCKVKQCEAKKILSYVVFIKLALNLCRYMTLSSSSA